MYPSKCVIEVPCDEHPALVAFAMILLNFRGRNVGCGKPRHPYE